MNVPILLILAQFLALALVHGADEKWRELYKASIVKAGKGDTDGAILDLTAALAANPKAVLAANYRGQLKQFQNNIDDAIADYNLALKIDPKFGPSYINRGKCYELQGNLKKALDDYSRAISARRGDPSGWSHRGVAKRMMGDYAGSLADLTHAIGLAPESVFLSEPRPDSGGEGRPRRRERGLHQGDRARSKRPDDLSGARDGEVPAGRLLRRDPGFRPGLEVQP